MDTAKLSVMCRCGHARRFHRSGTLFIGYDTACEKGGYTGEYDPWCQYFEVAEGWQESFASKLRAEGYLVERVVRDNRGRFLSPSKVSA